MAFDVAKGLLGQRGAHTGQQPRKGGCHDTGEGAPVDRQGQQRHAHVDGHVVAQQPQHGAALELDEDEDKAEEDGQTGFEHEGLLER